MGGWSDYYGQVVKDYTQYLKANPILLVESDFDNDGEGFKIKSISKLQDFTESDYQKLKLEKDFDSFKFTWNKLTFNKEKLSFNAEGNVYIEWKYWGEDNPGSLLMKFYVTANYQMASS